MSNEKPLGPIEHVVLLMFENRSFDNMLGGLYPASAEFDGVPKGWSNPVDPNNPKSPLVPAFQAPTSYDAQVMPFPDPNEDFDDMAAQINGGDMQGFVANYAKVISEHGCDPEHVQHIMQYYKPGPKGNIPVTSALANFYAVSDRYFGSGPVQTWANRLFSLCATPGMYTKEGKHYAYLNNTDYPNYNDWDPFAGQLSMPTVFELLDNAYPNSNVPNWKVYYNDEAPIAAFLKYVYANWSDTVGGNVYQFDSGLPDYADFLYDVKNNSLPKFSLIEPRYQKYSLKGFIAPNSNHPGGSTSDEGLPPISITDGEILLKKVFQTLAGNPELFKKTLLIVTYDEHGGLSDHVTPSSAISPFDKPIANFSYNRYGPRVPALFINPYIKPNTVLRPSKGVFDHTSVIATLREQFTLKAYLTARDLNAPTFAGLINTANALNMGPELPDLAATQISDTIPAELPPYEPPARPGSLADAMYRHYLAQRKARR